MAPKVAPGGLPRRRLAIAGLAALLSLILVPMAPAHGSGWKFRNLHVFCDKALCPGGSSPAGGLVRDKAGNLYGATTSGGDFGQGTVFELTADGRERVLYSFCAIAPDCADGSSPVGSLVMDQSRNLYGTTQFGGNVSPPEITMPRAGGDQRPPGFGVVFKVTPAGEETVLYKFCSAPKCADGVFPTGSLVVDASGNLYGTAGGGSSGEGVVFELTPAGEETILYNFCSLSGCADGAGPNGGLLIDQSGTLYGTTQEGGNAAQFPGGAGIAFKLTNAGAQTVLHTFCSLSFCTDGATPNGGLVRDKSGNLYGTASGGDRAPGIVFKLAENGTETVLHRFAHPVNADPAAGLAIDRFGNLFGTTVNGGRVFHGSVFEIISSGEQRLLHSFCLMAQCADGSLPQASLLIGPSGELFGTTVGKPLFCNNNVCLRGQPGSLFELKPRR